MQHQLGPTVIRGAQRPTVKCEIVSTETPALRVGPAVTVRKVNALQKLLPSITVKTVPVSFCDTVDVANEITPMPSASQDVPTFKSEAIIIKPIKPLAKIKKTPQSVTVAAIENESEKIRANLRTILNYSNATPIKAHCDMGYACCYCDSRHQSAADLKQHTIDKHEGLIFLKNQAISGLLVKLDITSLKCDICRTDIESLELLLTHLKDTHKKKIYTDVKNQILPFKFDSDGFRCFMCLNVFTSFKPLNEHMKKHYRNYICEICDEGFVNKKTLYMHSRIHKLGVFKCDQCSKVYDTLLKKNIHQKTVHETHLFKCGYCQDTFKYRRQKLKHLAEVHSVPSAIHTCQACNRQFLTPRTLNHHIRKVHLMERPHKCSQCDKDFYTASQLNDHMVKHTGAREFQCHHCMKSFARNKALHEHMRIHANDRRFQCLHCTQTFVQKCSWRSHMRSKHDDDV
ncbi:zinc finger protein 62 homolog [Pectinophora gossypiella]|uniref:zinc finger protein 62 homolog n=1 Tax=Pectinophora gossypiella TaxID=13191 RepID=UPI00214EDCA5|nr:zinc finger protein 62 homolog [Pectinophora gossypiella]